MPAGTSRWPETGVGIYDECVPDPTGTDKFRAVSRVVGRRAGQNRWTRASYAAGRGFLGSVRNVFHTLFHQVTGLFFFVFGVVVALAGIPEYRAYRTGKIGPGRAILAGALALLFLYFAVAAFVRSGRKRK